MITHEENKIDELRRLLLDVDLEKIDQIDHDLKDILRDLNERARLEKKINPLIDTKLITFQREIPDKLGPSITAALKKQARESQQEVVDALYPLIGKLVSRYIRREIELISARIDEKFEAAFSLEGWKRRLKAWFSGTKESELIIREIVPPELHELFVIGKENGILLGSYSHSKEIDSDMIAGMLTAIKAFSEDAFQKNKQELELIEYESYKIKIFNIGSYYIAAIISGVISTEFNLKLENAVSEFVTNYTKSSKNHSPDFEEVTKILSKITNRVNI